MINAMELLNQHPWLERYCHRNQVRFDDGVRGEIAQVKMVDLPPVSSARELLGRAYCRRENYENPRNYSDDMDVYFLDKSGAEICNLEDINCGDDEGRYSEAAWVVCMVKETPDDPFYYILVYRITKT